MPQSNLRLTSSAFENNGTIPVRYTCDGDQLSPPLTISDPPEGTQSFTLVIDDPDVPKEVNPDRLFVHWVLFNIAATTTEIEAGKAPGIEGLNSANNPGYYPPCPPTQYEPSEHRYIFHLYALDTELDERGGSASRDDIFLAMRGHIIAKAELMGRYRRPE